MRLDQALVEFFKVESRTKAQALIEAGKIQVSGKIVTKPSHPVADQSEVSILDQELLKYVSRAGFKLEMALAHLKLDVQGLRVLDMGQSTGGFSDCLLQNGVRKVVGVDVGHGQLHAKLQNHPQCFCIENTNVKDLRLSQVFQQQLQVGLFDLLVMDVSFISLTQVVEHVASCLKPNGEYLVLVKPQFECGPEGLDNQGRVKDHQFYSILEKNMRVLFEVHFGNVDDYFSSGLPGKEGNTEFFIYGKKTL